MAPERADRAHTLNKGWLHSFSPPGWNSNFDCADTFASTLLRILPIHFVVCQEKRRTGEQEKRRRGEEEKWAQIRYSTADVIQIAKIPFTF
jgi:hypothetical protein